MIQWLFQYTLERWTTIDNNDIPLLIAIPSRLRLNHI